MKVPQKVAEEVLVRCARHCCICRRFRPLHLQVHHIVEKSEGGTDEIDNLIATCVSCHTDVHNKATLTRRFTVSELKRHREAVLKLVEDGRLPSSDITRETIESVASQMTSKIQALLSQGATAGGIALPAPAIDLLLASVCEDAPIEVALNRDRNRNLFEITIGQRSYFSSRDDAATLPSEVEELLKQHLVRKGPDGYRLTSRGIAMVDDTIPNADARFSLVKAQCMHCGLHFMLCTWNPEKHGISSLHCPECGQCEGAFFVWKQREFGFIFQYVPGPAKLVESGR